MNLIDTYRTAPATEQAHLLLALMDEHDAGRQVRLTAPGASVDPANPCCPQCGTSIEEVNAVNYSVHHTEAELCGTQVVDQCAKLSDFHVTHYLTRCCQAAVSFDDRFTIDYL